MSVDLDISNKYAPQDLLRDLRQVMAGPWHGQERLNRIVNVIAENMLADVCSVYFVRSDKLLELSATKGLNMQAVHRARLALGEGLVGIIAEQARPINTKNAPQTKGYRYLPETCEEPFASFVGVPIQRLGRVLGVLVVQDKETRVFSPEEVDVLETVAMVIAEMSSTGRLIREEITGEDIRRQNILRGTTGADGIAMGTIVLHEPKIRVCHPIAENIDDEKKRLSTAMQAVRKNIDRLIGGEQRLHKVGEHRDVLKAFRMFAYDEGWVRRLEEAIVSGLSAEAAVEKVQSQVRARLGRVPDAYLRERLNDLDDLANRLLRELTGSDPLHPETMPDSIILVGRNIGPAELLEYGRQGLKGIVLKEGTLSSHAAIVARALNIPLLVQVGETEYELNSNDTAIIDGEQALLVVRPEPDIARTYLEKLTLRTQQRASLGKLRDLPCITRDGINITLKMNAGILADLPSIVESGAEGVGLYRTELQFMIRSTFPRREEQARIYRKVIEAGKGRQVVFRTLDIGSDKILPYLKRHEEQNPALGWRAIRVGLDRPLLMRMQIEALLRGSAGYPLHVMFPMVAEHAEFKIVKQNLLTTYEKFKHQQIACATHVKIGAMLETPSLAYESNAFYKDVDFLSVGGNDLLQFFYAADRENERVGKRYSTFNTSYIRFLKTILDRAAMNGTPISFCGESASNTLEAILLTALGFRSLSMRPAAIGLVKRTLRSIHLGEITKVINQLTNSDVTNIRPAFIEWIEKAGISYQLD